MLITVTPFLEEKHNWVYHETHVCVDLIDVGLLYEIYIFYHFKNGWHFQSQSPLVTTHHLLLILLFLLHLMMDKT